MNFVILYHSFIKINHTQSETKAELPFKVYIF